MEFIAFDLETTGTLPGVDRIVEIGAVRFVDGEVTSVFSTLVDPGISIPEGASRVNGITDDMVAGKPKVEDLLVAMTEFCGDSPLVAHNAPFDFQFLVADMKRYEISGPQGLVFDTYNMAKKVFPGLQNYKLGTLVEHLKIPSSDFHRAEEDATYCGKLFMHILGKIYRPGEEVSFENLIALSGRGEMRFPKIERQPKQLDMFAGL